MSERGAGEIIAFPMHRAICLRIGDVAALVTARRLAAISAYYEIDPASARALNREMSATFAASVGARAAMREAHYRAARRAAHAQRFRALRSTSEGRKALARSLAFERGLP